MSEPVQIETIQNVAAPAYLHQRLETFQIGKGGRVSYLLKDKVLSKNFELEAWQFFVLEVLPGCQTFGRLAAAFQDRFGRAIGRQELEDFYAQVADAKLFNDDAAKHPLLAPFCLPAYDVEDRMAKARSLSGRVTAGVAAWESSSSQVASLDPESGGKFEEAKDLPAGVKEAIGLDPDATRPIWRLFDPRPLLKRIAPVLASFRYTVYVFPLLMLVALLVVIYQAQPLLQEIARLYKTPALIVDVLISILGINVLVTLICACIAYAYRCTVGGIGISLFFGFIPGFVPYIGNAAQMSRRERCWLHAAPLVTLCTLLGIGVLVWCVFAGSKAGLSSFGLALLLVCTAEIVIAAGNPLVKGSAYHLLAAILDQPKLRAKASSTLFNGLLRRSYQKADSEILQAYALAVGVYLYVVICLALIVAGNGLTNVQVSGSEVIFIGALGIYLFTAAYLRLKKVNETYERSLQFARWKDQTPAIESEAAAAASGRSPPTGFGTFAMRAVPLMILIILLLPYPYEPGGNVTFYPVLKVELAPDVEGIVSDVYFDGGEFVKKGTPIARIKDDDNYAKLQQLNAEVEEQESVVRNLKTLPKPEAVKLAEADLQIAITEEQFSKEKEPRIFKLYKQGAVSFDEYDSIKKQHDVDVDNVAQKKAQLELVKVGPTADEIAAAESKLTAFKSERDDYQDKVNRSVLYMPFDGRIMTMHLKDKTNLYLERGKFFAAVEDPSKMTVEIDVPEQDIGYVAVGQKVRAREQAYNTEIFDGEVTTIDPSVTTQVAGNIVKVIAVINNPDGKLKAGMSGYAKTSGRTMPVWKAFTLALLTFFNIDVWSWIP